MKKPRQRFTSESLIISKIDALNAKILEKCKTAEQSDKTADELFQKLGLIEDPSKLKGQESETYLWQLAQAKEARRNAALLRRAQGRLQQLLKQLKDTLAAFRTQPMAFMEDQSVPLARG